MPRRSILTARQRAALFDLPTDEAINTHDYFQLSRLSRWHVDSDAINQALAMVIEA